MDWGVLAREQLAAMRGQHAAKKRRTLVALADALVAGLPQASVFKNEGCGSKMAHYKWRKIDGDYETAYLFLVGLAKGFWQEREDALEAEAVLAVVEARRQLSLKAPTAVSRLSQLLDAESFTADMRVVPDNGTRLRAANSILDRTSATALKSEVNFEAIEVRLVDYRAGITETEG